MAIISSPPNVYIYSNFVFNEANEVSEDILTLQQNVFSGLFSNGDGTLHKSDLYTSSTDTSKAYFVDVYDTSSSKVQFSLTYGHYDGSGSAYTDSEKPSKVIYSKLSNLLLDSSDKLFTFKSASSDENKDVRYVTSMIFKRNVLKDKIDVNSWNLIISGTGTNKLTLVDDSVSNSPLYTSNGRKYYYIVSGTLDSNGVTIYNSSNPHYYGHVYPELGLLLFNGEELNTKLFNFNLNSNSTSPNNIETFYNTFITASFRNEEQLNSSYYFIRVKNKDFNFSTNPTYVTGSKVINGIEKRGIPLTYITTVGLYNNLNELLAVAKLSKPIFKEPGSEVLIKVRIDY